MAARWPFADNDAMLRAAAGIWRDLDRADWLEAFRAHPKIGDRSGSKWSQEEQAGTALAARQERDELERLNREYEERFGYIFIVCATGKTAEQMLDQLRSRLRNAPDDEINIAADEQRQITRLRLLKWHDEISPVSPITTHVLDTALGKPAAGIRVALELESEGRWLAIGNGVTGDDGRVRDLLSSGKGFEAGKYRISFDTAHRSPFYPRIEIVFLVENASEHYHVPLLLSPFGYSTYRGS